MSARNTNNRLASLLMHTLVLPALGALWRHLGREQQTLSRQLLRAITTRSRSSTSRVIRPSNGLKRTEQDSTDSKPLQS